MNPDHFTTLYNDLIAYAGKIDLMIQSIDAEKGELHFAQNNVITVLPSLVDQYMSGDAEQRRQILAGLVSKCQVVFVGPSAHQTFGKLREEG